MSAYGRNVCLTAIASFATGFVVALLVAPESGQKARRRLANCMQTQTRKISDQLHAIEDQLVALEKQIHATGDQFGKRMVDVTQKAVDQYVPKLPPDVEQWEIDSSEVARDLRRMPR